ncbi:hypothetical protein DVH24_027014 [Malus domestica]|uniref:Uncharacterized protein n=1 Tax=Malus domestica TaxID=3750 RepID=A0A498IPR3_MALDO|nr:hypothetical protein DVH24_027014 [Malus domestica]
MAHQTSKISFFVVRVNRISVLRITFTLVDGLELPLSVMLLNCIFILPLTVPTLVAKTLVVLTVYSDCITYVTTKECLPSLKVLSVSIVWPDTDSFTSQGKFVFLLSCTRRINYRSDFKTS